MKTYKVTYAGGIRTVEAESEVEAIVIVSNDQSVLDFNDVEVAQVVKPVQVGTFS